MKEYIAALIAPLVTLIYSLVSPYIFGTNGYVEYASKMIDAEKYQNTILIKNIRENEYLREIDFVVSDEITMDNLTINGVEKNTISNTITLLDIIPQDVSIISFRTNKKIDDSNMHIIKNDQILDISYFNHIGNINVKIFIIIAIYALINIIFAYFSNNRIKKNKIHCEEIISEQDGRMVEIEKKFEEIVRREKINKTVHIKEMRDMEKELEFYKSIIIKICNKSITKKELEEEITKSLKTFSNKKLKYLNYDDIYNVVDELVNAKNIQ